jgi:peptide/nickel transport system substrate-binding protein
MLLFNLKDPLFSEKSLRQAISYAVDKKDLIDKAIPGEATPTNGPFQPGSWPYNPDSSYQRSDPQKARRLLADLGWKDSDRDWILEKGGKKLAFTILMDQGDAMKERAAKRLQWQLLQVGIQLNAEALPQEEFFQGRLFPGKFQAALLQFNTAGDPDHTLADFWESSSIGKSNLAAYRNPEVDRLIAEGRATSDQEKRTPIYRKIGDTISEDTPAVFLLYRTKFSAASSRIGGIESAFQLSSILSVGDFFFLDQK